MAKEKMAPRDISQKMGDGKQAALSKALSKIEKDFGKGAIMKLGEKTSMKIETISSGSIALDVALGVGGYPKGRILEVYGPESSGKTTMALHAIAEAQKAGGTAAFIDAEHALDPKYAAALGVNIDDLLLSQPDTGEQALEIADALVSSGAVDIWLSIQLLLLFLVPKSKVKWDKVMLVFKLDLCHKLFVNYQDQSIIQKLFVSLLTKFVRKLASCLGILK